MPVMMISASAGVAIRWLIASCRRCTYGRCCGPVFMATGNMIASANVAPKPTTTAETCTQTDTS